MINTLGQERNNPRWTKWIKGLKKKWTYCLPKLGIGKEMWSFSWNLIGPPLLFLETICKTLVCVVCEDFESSLVGEICFGWNEKERKERWVLIINLVDWWNEVGLECQVFREHSMSKVVFLGFTKQRKKVVVWWVNDGEEEERYGAPFLSLQKEGWLIICWRLWPMPSPTNQLEIWCLTCIVGTYLEIYFVMNLLLVLENCMCVYIMRDLATCMGLITNCFIHVSFAIVEFDWLFSIIKFTIWCGFNLFDTIYNYNIEFRNVIWTILFYWLLRDCIDILHGIMLTKVVKIWRVSHHPPVERNFVPKFNL